MYCRAVNKLVIFFLKVTWAKNKYAWTRKWNLLTTWRNCLPSAVLLRVIKGPSPWSVFFSFFFLFIFWGGGTPLNSITSFSSRNLRRVRDKEILLGAIQYQPFCLHTSCKRSDTKAHFNRALCKHILIWHGVPTAMPLAECLPLCCQQSTDCQLW